MNKEKIQKIVASVLTLTVLTYCYFNFLLGPQNKKITDRQEQAAKLEEEIRRADTQIARTQSLEPQGIEAEEFLARAEAFFPEGAPIAWFPPMMRKFFKRLGIEEVVLTPKGTTPAGPAALDDYEQLIWDVQLTSVDFLKAGTALAALENEQPFTAINFVQVVRGASLAEQRVSFELAFTDKKDQ